MGRNFSRGAQILELENAVLAGINFWPKSVARDIPSDPKITKVLNVPKSVINKIMTRKRNKADLAEDLNQIRKRI